MVRKIRACHKPRGIGHNGKAAQLVVGVHQMRKAEYTGANGLTGSILPAKIPVRSALSSSPKARASSENIFYKVWWRRVRGTIPQVPEGTAHYKCAPLPIRVNPPLSKTRCASKASDKVLVEADGVEPSGVSFADPAREPAAPIGAFSYLRNGRT
jgi:hypothetical protein